MKIALLATGDELTTGDILNTNGQKIAQSLFDMGFSIGSHVLVADDETEMVKAIDFLRQSHDVIILTGGLGPTSDDRTRFALASANNKTLFFDDASWQAIEERLNRYRLEIHESNKQQSYFPEGAEVLPNPHGTAAGCRLQTDDALFFMLPGPPKECLPMFFEQVQPYLLKHLQHTKYEQKKWRLFGVSEGEIAAELDKLTADFPVTTGYRWDYPYLEFKLLYEAGLDLKYLPKKLEERIQQISICSAEQTAVEAFLEQLNQLASPINICDEATAGLLQHRLWQPETSKFLNFTAKDIADIHITGLDELWANKTDSNHTIIRIQGNYNNSKIEEEKEIPFRNRRVVDYAVEFIAYKLQELIL